MTLYDDHKDRWDEIALEAPNVAAMARHFTRHQDMCDALLFDRSTVSHWIKGRSRVSAGAERRAEMWLKNGMATKRVPDEAPRPLPRLPRDLTERGVAASYVQCWRYATAGRIPATLRGARWYYDPAELPRIAAQFGADQ